MILHSKVIGDKEEQLCIVHGLFGQSDNWGTLGRMFSEHYTVHLIDLRNHGRSFHDSQMNLNVMADDLAEYLESKNLKKANFLGHSLGGKVAMELALKSSEKVEKLIVADIAPKNYPPHHQAIIKALSQLNFNVIKTRKEAEEVLKQYIPELGVRQFLLKNLYWKEKNQLALRFNLKVISENYSYIVGENTVKNTVYHKPTLFLKGSNSNYIVKEDESIISSYFSNYKIETIENAGHWVHAENPKDVYAKVVAFLNG